MKPLTDKRESPYRTGCGEGDPEARGRHEGRDTRRLSFDGGGASGGAAGTFELLGRARASAEAP